MFKRLNGFRTNQCFIVFLGYSSRCVPLVRIYLSTWVRAYLFPLVYSRFSLFDYPWYIQQSRIKIFFPRIERLTNPDVELILWNVSNLAEIIIIIRIFIFIFSEKSRLHKNNIHLLYHECVHYNWIFIVLYFTITLYFTWRFNNFPYSTSHLNIYHLVLFLRNLTYFCLRRIGNIM